MSRAPIFPLLVLAALALLLLASSRAFAQLDMGGDLVDECAKIEKLRKAGDIPAAKKAASDCLEGLERETVLGQARLDGGQGDAGPGDAHAACGGYPGGARSARESSAGCGAL